MWTSDQDGGAGSRSGSPPLHADSNGSLWVLGGYIINFKDPIAVWNYNPDTNEYRWVSGFSNSSEVIQNLYGYSSRIGYFNTTSGLWTFISGNNTAQAPIDYNNPEWNGRWDAGCTNDIENRIWLFEVQAMI